MITHTIKYLSIALLLSAGFAGAMEPVAGMQAIIRKYNPETDKKKVAKIFRQNFFRFHQQADPEAYCELLLNPVDKGDASSEKTINVLVKNGKVKGYEWHYFYSERGQTKPDLGSTHKGWIEGLGVNRGDAFPEQAENRTLLFEHALQHLNQRHADFVKTERSAEQKAFALEHPDLITTDYGVHTDPLMRDQRQNFLKKYGFAQLPDSTWEFAKPFNQ